MKKYLFLLPVLVLALLIQGCSSKPAESQKEMIKAADELDKKFGDAFNKGDVNAVMETYWNNTELVSFSPDALEGANYEQCKVGLTKALEAMKGATLQFSKSQNTVAGEVVLGSGYWTITLPDSASTKLNGRYTDVKAKKDGKWVYIMDHASVPLPPPTQ